MVLMPESFASGIGYPGTTTQPIKNTDVATTSVTRAYADSLPIQICVMTAPHEREGASLYPASPGIYTRLRR